MRSRACRGDAIARPIRPWRVTLAPCGEDLPEVREWTWLTYGKSRVTLPTSGLFTLVNRRYPLATADRTRWQMTGQGYEFCNCDFGCGCNFGGFPNSKDGSCRALVGFTVSTGRCGDVDLAGVKGAGIFVWPKAIHEGNGKAAFIVDPSTSQSQVDALAQIFTGKLGGMPWELLGPTFEVVGLTKAKITVEGSGRKSTFRIEGVGEGRGDTLKNPVSGEDQIVNVDLPTGFIWKKGEAGQGSFRAAAAGLSVSFDKTNWIYYRYDWSNAA